MRPSQIIRDKIFHGVLDQGRRCLLIFGEPEADNTYGAVIDTLEQVGKVADSLYAKTVKLTTPLGVCALLDPLGTRQINARERKMTGIV